MIRWFILCLPLVLTILLRLFWNKKGFADWYASTIFPFFPNTIGRLFSPIPFSIYEWILYVLAFFCLSFLLYLLVTFIRWIYVRIQSMRGKRRKLSFRQNRSSSHKKQSLFRIIYAITFLVCWGIFLLHATDLINYRRTSVAVDFGLTMKPSSVKDLTALCEELAKDLNTLSKQIEVDEEGLLKLPSTYEQDAKKAMEQLGKTYPAFSGYYPNPKPVTFSRGMSHLNLTGMYSPFTIEANYNKDAPSYNIPYTICHELAHLKGFIREDEAGFIAYMACSSSNDPTLRYSGTLSAFIYATNALYSTGDTKDYQKIFNQLSKQVLRDIQYNSFYWNQFEGTISDVAESANDLYLKANHQEDGVQSYGRMVDLMLALYHSK